ncbi:MarR family winged helix-turn-helix transcriptional regulator [Actinacidiphila soli]|jgi:DNA-binding MarR family transcriptional regulator|uniref:MarR family winged helix-turn-helix transcriptional regulator n=1 Tax=Actinacidiphila soli TaxID=2487275 RepID=UPI000FCA7819|nr:MarR family transcriptional regulator [Actinacidiphila soli]
MTTIAHTPPQPVSAGLDLTGLLQHAAHVLTTQTTAALGELDISPRGFCVLAHALPGGLTQAQVAELSRLDKTTMVVTVDELEKAGLAERVPSPTDRRARIIRVTEEGRKTVEAGREITEHVHGDVLGALPEQEREAFASALVRLVNGHLAEPVECERPVRRARQSRK